MTFREKCLLTTSIGLSGITLSLIAGAESALNAGDEALALAKQYKSGWIEAQELAREAYEQASEAQATVVRYDAALAEAIGLIEELNDEISKK